MNDFLGNKKQKRESMSVKEIFEFYRELKAKANKDAVRDCAISPIESEKGFNSNKYKVSIIFGTAFEYDEEYINDIKEMLNADDWSLNVKGNKLYIHFYIHE